MTLRLYDANSNREIRLWNGQEFQPSVAVDEEVFNPAATTVNETVVSVLQQEEDITINGITLGSQRIAEGATATSDRIEAVAEWVADLEAWVNGSPGTAGFRLENSYTGETIDVVPRSVGWSRAAGETNAVEYDVELAVGGGLDSDLGISPQSVSPGGPDTYDGVELPHIYERNVDKQIGLTTRRELFGDSAEENDQFVESSAVRRITLLGDFDGTFSEQRTFDDKLRSRAGQGETYTFSSAFPGLDSEAALVGYESTREAGVTQKGDYAVELVVGQAL